MSKAISKNRTAPILSAIVSAKCFSLGNGFVGTEISKLDWLRDYAKVMGAKVFFDASAKQGEIRFNYNEWYEFKTA